MARDHANSQEYFRVAKPYRKPDGSIGVHYEGPYERPAVAKGMVTRAIKDNARWYKRPDFIDPVIERGVVTWDTTEVDKIRDNI